jgi:acetoin utilization protein AcuC
LDQNDVQEKGSIFVFSEGLGWFDFGQDHPFKPERAIKTYDLCSRYGLLNHPWMILMDPDPLDPSLLTSFHEPAYVDALEKAGRREVDLEILGRGLGTEDNPILLGIYDWALRVAGGTVTSMERLLDDKAAAAFNPFGGFHHGLPDHAEGFCYINDIVIAIKEARKRQPHIRIAYADLDAHHGNGVQEAFYEDSGVLFISLHETGKSLYPWSGMETERGEGEGTGYTINVPLEPGTDDDVYERALVEILFPVISSFSPDLVVAEIGADALVSDPLTNLKLTNNVYQQAVRGLVEGSPRILALGGGGYDLYRTARCWTLAWAILNHLEPQDEYAGLVGGMMFGPEMEVGSLFDHPYRSEGDVKEKALKELDRIIAYLRKHVLPIHGL